MRARWGPSSTFAPVWVTMIPFGAGGLLLLRLGMPGMREGLQFIDDLIWRGTFDGRFRERDNALRVFNEHNQAVQATIPADRLLVFDVKQGWEPLCRFLGLPVPAGEPFPHLSDTSSAQKEIRERYRVVALRAGAIAASASWGLALTWQGRRTLRSATGLDERGAGPVTCWCPRCPAHTLPFPSPLAPHRRRSQVDAAMHLDGRIKQREVSGYCRRHLLLAPLQSAIA